MRIVTNSTLRSGEVVADELKDVTLPMGESKPANPPKPLFLHSTRESEKSLEAWVGVVQARQQHIQLDTTRQQHMLLYKTAAYSTRHGIQPRHPPAYSDDYKCYEYTADQAYARTPPAHDFNDEGKLEDALKERFLPIEVDLRGKINVTKGVGIGHDDSVVLSGDQLKAAIWISGLSIRASGVGLGHQNRVSG